MKTWFITGTSRGFGREWAIAALDRGDKVAATARNLGTLDDLVTKYGDAILPIKLDVTDREAAFAAVRQAHERFGWLDVVLNNAGYGQFGMVEEISEAEIRAQLDTNVLGALWVTQAALPLLREQGRGHIIQVSSIGGVSAFMNTGAYHASKWALEGFSQSLSQEVAGFGIKVTLIEPGGLMSGFKTVTRAAKLFWPELVATIVGLAFLVTLLLLVSAGTGTAWEKTVSGILAAAGLSLAGLTGTLKNSAQAMLKRLRQDSYTDLVAIAVQTAALYAELAARA